MLEALCLPEWCDVYIVIAEVDELCCVSYCGI